MTNIQLTRSRAHLKKLPSTKTQKLLKFQWFILKVLSTDVTASYRSLSIINIYDGKLHMAL
jgi:hypothetical protein